jgi:hypothetical protein
LCGRTRTEEESMSDEPVFRKVTKISNGKYYRRYAEVGIENENYPEEKPYSWDFQDIVPDEAMSFLPGEYTITVEYRSLRKT